MFLLHFSLFKLAIHSDVVHKKLCLLTLFFSPFLWLFFVLHTSTISKKNVIIIKLFKKFNKRGIILYVNMGGNISNNYN